MTPQIQGRRKKKTLYKYWSVRILLLAELAPTKALNYCNVLSDQPCNYTACHHTNHSTPVICWLQLAAPPTNPPTGTPTHLVWNHRGALNLRSCGAGQSPPLPAFTDPQGGGGDCKGPDKLELSRPPGDKTRTVKKKKKNYPRSCCIGTHHRDRIANWFVPFVADNIYYKLCIVTHSFHRLCCHFCATWKLTCGGLRAALSWVIHHCKHHVCFRCCHSYITVGSSRVHIDGKTSALHYHTVGTCYYGPHCETQSGIFLCALKG